MLAWGTIYMRALNIGLKDKFDRLPKLSVSSRRSMLNILAPFAII